VLRLATIQGEADEAVTACPPARDGPCGWTLRACSRALSKVGHVFSAEDRDTELRTIERAPELGLYVRRTSYFSCPRPVIVEIQINRSIIINGPELGTLTRTSETESEGEEG